MNENENKQLIRWEIITNKIEKKNKISLPIN